MTSDVKASSRLDEEQVDSPPAYQESASAQRLESTQGLVPPHFPVHWVLHGKKANFVNLMTWQYTISSYETKRPLFAATISRLHMTLHSNTDTNSAPLAKATFSSRDSTNCNLSLLAAGRPSYSVIMCSHNFTLPITRTGSQNFVLETFQWRRSSGQEVSAIDADTYGWKLVRLDPEGIKGPGEEVVATWAVPTGLNLTHVASIRFWGSGASGVLGHDWAVFVALSVLRVYQAEMIGSVV